MLKEVTLALEELYFLGKQMNAKYMNYAYISAMPDISQHRSLYEQKCTESLMEKGWLEESFFGEITISQELKELLHPVFFGDKQISLEQIDLPASSGSIMYLHGEGREVRKAWLDNTLIHLEDMPVEKIEGFLQSFLLDGRDASKRKRDMDLVVAKTGFDGRNVKRLFDKVLYIKGIVVGKNLLQKTFCFQDEKCYLKDDGREKPYKEISCEEFLRLTNQIIGMGE